MRLNYLALVINVELKSANNTTLYIVVFVMGKQFSVISFVLLNVMLVLLLICFVPVWGRPQAPAPGQTPSQPPPQPQQPTQQPQPHQAGISTVSPIPIISQSESVGGDGSFNFSYETGNGIHVQEGGYIKKAQLPQGRNVALNANGTQSAGDEDVQVITGAFSYTAPDGTAISLKYIADENGFQPEGAHLPTAPPIPPEIQKALNLQPKKTDHQRSVQDVENHPSHEEHQSPVNIAQTTPAAVEESSSPLVPSTDVV